VAGAQPLLATVLLSVVLVGPALSADIQPHWEHQDDPSLPQVPPWWGLDKQFKVPVPHAAPQVAYVFRAAGWKDASALETECLRRLMDSNRAWHVKVESTQSVLEQFVGRSTASATTKDAVAAAIVAYPELMAQLLLLNATGGVWYGSTLYPRQGFESWAEWPAEWTDAAAAEEGGLKVFWDKPVTSGCVGLGFSKGEVRLLSPRPVLLGAPRCFSVLLGLCEIGI